MPITIQTDYAILALYGAAGLVGLIAGIVVAKRIQQFSLRTLLIAMTLLAVVLGLVVLATKH
jgi:predicted MFS family arabinose efflux permease